MVARSDAKLNLSLPLGEGGALAPDEVPCVRLFDNVHLVRFALGLPHPSASPPPSPRGRLMVKQRSSVIPDKPHKPP